ncbi:hypothetical protein PSN45_002897 [Yamadazyma tenuis]|uniref:Uncharacterized protein n=1 Tax=Candida tenuis (strain ATCC 10573 / BCRC 21748 / CBS 615 / JCM 9827 / NBRC 10315 / NRRL Y-1498 / VKM Y-70) TaxID=590646 RepID=G3AWC1_CANTC|nr:uncharacterized protein CANTEDRAFT_100439 [Yamadazyma tenuis ATCC 10573]EGV66508.1 hypothetical protein CANTEDRAFT_100439 [Yamadazyma tenuis ATCC 10573]WEJ95380.1 hypothetical protein PSN45_002897 [Yamadazyma tenuis]
MISTISHASTHLYPTITALLSTRKDKKYNRDRWTLQELDNWKDVELPQILKRRVEKQDGCYLTVPELKLLMDWKLAKGKFRPMLPKLISANLADDVERVTRTAMMMFVDGVCEFESLAGESREKYTQLVKKAMVELCRLKGVGPATASLVLSLLWSVSALSPPFFSDESFLYYVRPATKIKYNLKEYTDEYLPVFLGILEQEDEVTMNSLEKGGWALKMLEIHRDGILKGVAVGPYEGFLDHYADKTRTTKKRKLVDDKVPTTKRKHAAS